MADTHNLSALPAEIQKLLASGLVINNKPVGRGYGKTIPMPPKEFPEYKFHEYPKMVLEEVTKDYQEHWRFKNSYDAGNGTRAYMGAAPKLGTKNMRFATVEDVNHGFAQAVDGPVVLTSKAHEREWENYASGHKPPPPEIVSVRDVIAQAPTNQTITKQARRRPGKRVVKELPA